MSKEKIVYTNGIPQCTNCNKPTIRSSRGSSITLMNFSPIYDEQGKNTNPDLNTITSNYFCHNCNKGYSISGNSTKGFKYDNFTTKIVDKP